MKSLIVFAALLLTLSGCKTWLTEATATENALCKVWGQSLPTRSRQDTPQTQAEIGEAYVVFAAACPDHRDLVPL